MRLLPLLALALALPALAQPALAQSEPQVFEMRLGGRVLGTLTYDGAAAIPFWRTDLDNTPLGVADGTFIASSEPVQTDEGQAARRYRGDTATSRRSRVVEVIHAAGRALATTVTPPDDATDLSVASRVPGGVIDPVEALAVFLNSGGCPPPIRIYDGRRVVDVTPAGATTEGTRLTCEHAYTVVAGPGHLSPLGITQLGVTLIYDQPEGGPATLREMDVRTGLLRLRVVR